MKKTAIIMVLSVFALLANAQEYERFDLWENGAPKENNATAKEETIVEDGNIVRFNNISKAEIFVYHPKEKINTGASIVICPGGGYSTEAASHEGFQIAEFLCQRGITAVVLKYRLPYGDPDIPIVDAQQAIRYLRSKAEEWSIDENKIGIAGASAGGHLAAFVSTNFNKPVATTELEGISCKPDFSLLLYPVISMDEKIGHMGSRINLIGKTNSWKKAKAYSNEYSVTKDTPPTFLVLADDDDAVVPQNSIEYYMALKKNNVPAEMHIYAGGGHGFGMKNNNIPTDNWELAFFDWLKALKIIE